MTSNLSVTAHFEPAAYSLNLNPSPPEGGSTIGGGGFDLGEVAQVTATANPGYAFAGWEGGNVADANASSTSITISESTTLTAKFKALNYQIQVAASPIGSGQATGDGNYSYGSEANLVATPVKGYVFSHWSGANLADSANANQTLSVSGNLSLVANFTRHPEAGTLSYALDAIALDGGWKESSWFGRFHQLSSGWAYHYDLGWIYTKPEDESSIWFWREKLGWMWTNKEIYPHAWRQDNYDWTYFSRLLDGSFAYYDYGSSTWRSDLDIYQVQVVAFPSAGGSVSGSGNYKDGEIASLVATPAEGYVFKRWFNDLISSSPSISITVRGELIIYAEFQKISP